MRLDGPIERELIIRWALRARIENCKERLKDGNEDELYWSEQLYYCRKVYDELLRGEIVLVMKYDDMREFVEFRGPVRYSCAWCQGDIEEDQVLTWDDGKPYHEPCLNQKRALPVIEEEVE